MKDDLSFEKAMVELENIVVKLENGQDSLDESVELFKKGMKISHYASKKLDEAEKKITILVEKNGEYKEEPFEIE